MAQTIDSRMCEWCEEEYDSEKSLAHFPTRFCSRECELKDQEEGDDSKPESWSRK